MIREQYQNTSLTRKPVRSDFRKNSGYSTSRECTIHHTTMFTPPSCASLVSQTCSVSRTSTSCVGAIVNATIRFASLSTYIIRMLESHCRLYLSYNTRFRPFKADVRLRFLVLFIMIMYFFPSHSLPFLSLARPLTLVDCADRMP